MHISSLGSHCLLNAAGMSANKFVTTSWMAIVAVVVVVFVVVVVMLI